MSIAKRIEDLVFDENSFIVKLHIREGLDLDQINKLKCLLADYRKEINTSDIISKRTALALVEIVPSMLFECEFYPQEQKEQINQSALDLHYEIIQCLADE